MPGEILVSRAGDLATVVLSNPEKLNALNAAMWRALGEALTTLSADDGLRCVVLRGAGEQAFAAGGDIEEFARLRDTEERALAYHEWVGAALAAIRDCRHPTLALIRGHCIGGGLEIAAQCDLRICGESSRFGVPISRLGFTMYHAELAGLVALAGPAVALELLLEGRIFPAREAYEKGLVTRLVPDERVEEETLACAGRIAAGAPLVATWHKKLTRRLAFTPAPLSPEEVRENLAWLGTEDYREGIAAFLEKRVARFRGR
jgi:enoyl-CoA hydratase/carnithine racemase